MTYNIKHDLKHKYGVIKKKKFTEIMYCINDTAMEILSQHIFLLVRINCGVNEL